MPTLLLAAILAAGALLRVWAAFSNDGIHHPDEIYQGLEPAHRLVFGYGLRAWEFTQGARNWAFPGFVAALLKTSTWIGPDDPQRYLMWVRLVFCALSVASAFASYALARACGASGFAATSGSAFYALIAPAIFFAPRAIPEGVSALLVPLGFALFMRTVTPLAEETGTRFGTRMLAVSLIGLATLFRIQNGIFCVGLLALSVANRRWREFFHSLVILFVWAILFGLIDKLTWGEWFHSAIVYIRFNLIDNGASNFGTRPFWYYAQVLWSSIGWPILALLPLFVFAALRKPGLTLVVLAFLWLHALIPHKEMRFILPALPLLGALAGVGLEVISRRVSPSAAVVCAGLFLGTCLWSGFHFQSLTEDDLDASDNLFSLTNFSDQSASVNRLLLAAYREPDLCGLNVKAFPLVWTGGYTYLHRKVPLYSQAAHHPRPGTFNYAIMPIDSVEQGETRATEGMFVLVRFFHGPCTADPNYEFQLPK